MRRPEAPRPRFIAGDPLRAVAALSVVVYHIALLGKGTGQSLTRTYGLVPGRVLRSFDAGLFIFFALSGYLIGGPFVRAFLNGTGSPSVASYLRRRLLRIVPAFWVIFTVVLLCVGPMGDSPGGLMAAYGFAQNFDSGGVARVMGQAWTLDVEVAFYLLVPAAAAVMCFLARRWSRSARTWVFFLGVVVVAVVSLVFRSRRPDAFTWVTSLPAMLFAFIPGLLLAGVEQVGGPTWFRRSRGRGYAAAILASGGGLLVLYCLHVAPEVPQYLGGVNAVLVAGGAGLVVAAPLTYQWATGCCYRAMDNRVMRWVGERSYSVYLVHQPMIAASVVGWERIIANPTERMILSAPVTMATVLAASAVSYRYVERPFLRLRPLARRPLGLGKPPSSQEPVVPGTRRWRNRLLTRPPSAYDNAPVLVLTPGTEGSDHEETACGVGPSARRPVGGRSLRSDQAGGTR